MGGEETLVLAKGPRSSAARVCLSPVLDGVVARVRRATGAGRAGLPGLELGNGCQAFRSLVRGMTPPPTVNNNLRRCRKAILDRPLFPRTDIFEFYCSYLHALSPTTVRLLARSLKVDRTKSFVPGWRFGTPRKGWVLLTSVTQTESCRTRLRLSLLQPFAGVARSPFVEAGGFPLESMSPWIMKRLDPKMPGRLVSRRLTVSWTR